jgi:hypothetical protein
VLRAFHKTLDKDKGKNERNGLGTGGGPWRGLSGQSTTRSDGRADSGFSTYRSPTVRDANSDRPSASPPPSVCCFDRLGWRELVW